MQLCRHMCNLLRGRQLRSQCLDVVAGLKPGIQAKRFFKLGLRQRSRTGRGINDGGVQPDVGVPWIAPNRIAEPSRRGHVVAKQMFDPGQRIDDRADTRSENDRALYYADTFKFDHTSIRAPSLRDLTVSRR